VAAPSVVTGGCPALTQEATAAALRVADEEEARRRQGPLECDSICGWGD
jgi:hypothetical protein